MELRHRLEERGHQVVFAGKTLADLKFDVNRVARLVEKTRGDAWVIRAGPRAVLEWFAAQKVPTFAMFGRQTKLPIASLATLKSPAMAMALRRLVDLGHRRIVMMAREERRKPTPGLFERRFLDELERLEIEVGPYNLPDWENDRRSFHRCLDSLFRHTPPTAIFLSETALFFATIQYLSDKGLAAPRDLSLICMDDHPAFDWFEPEVSRLHTDTRRWVPRVVQWADNVAKGKKDRRETLIRAKFIEGRTIGPVPAHGHPS
jgi:DNA-binding LacI/PurR family transcriptional regulator